MSQKTDLLKYLLDILRHMKKIVSGDAKLYVLQENKSYFMLC